MLKVYLAGGMRTPWRNTIKAEVDDFDYIDVCYRDKAMTAAGLNSKSPKEYIAWDSIWVKNSDIVFGYMEKTNPSPVGLACELSYAYGLGKTTILVLEKENQFIKDRYLDFMRGFATVDFSSFNIGVDFLQTLAWTK
jgi:nucleoside 2-deoxyribosyltransferase